MSRRLGPTPAAEEVATDPASRSLRRGALRRQWRMEDKEPTYCLAAGGLMVAAGILSYLAPDITNISKKVGTKTQLITEHVSHPTVALALIGLGVLVAVSVLAKNRLLSGLVLLLGATLGISLPLPAAVAALRYALYAAPAFLAIWMLVLRPRKAQQAARAAAAAERSARPAGRGRSRPPAARASRNTRTSRSRGHSEPEPTGRPKPPPSARYTPPRSPGRPGGRRG